jgi:hypothetical protein
MGPGLQVFIAVIYDSDNDSWEGYSYMRSVFQTFLSAVESYLIIFTPPPKYHTLATCHIRYTPFSLPRALAGSRRLPAPAGAAPTAGTAPRTMWYHAPY